MHLKKCLHLGSAILLQALCNQCPSQAHFQGILYGLNGNMHCHAQAYNRIEVIHFQVITSRSLKLKHGELLPTFTTTGEFKHYNKLIFCFINTRKDIFSSGEDELSCKSQFRQC